MLLSALRRQILSHGHAILCLEEGILPGLPHNRSTMEDPPKRTGKLIEFSQPHDAVARIEAFVGRLIESTDVLSSALVRLRDFYLAGAPPMVADQVLAQVDAALEMAARTRIGF